MRRRLVTTVLCVVATATDSFTNAAGTTTTTTTAPSLIQQYKNLHSRERLKETHTRNIIISCISELRGGSTDISSDAIIASTTVTPSSSGTIQKRKRRRRRRKSTEDDPISASITPTFPTTPSTTTDDDEGDGDDDDPFSLLASALHHRISQIFQEQNPNNNGGAHIDTNDIRRALKSLSTSQSALKGLDGAAHEAYQRTRRRRSSSSKKELISKDDDEDDDDNDASSGVSGRATRSASRMGCIADGLLAAELCELGVQMRDGGGDGDIDIDIGVEEEEGEKPMWTLSGRSILLNVTNVIIPSEEEEGEGGEYRSLPSMSILVLHDPSYTGGHGLNHGGIDDLTDTTDEHDDDDYCGSGRILVIINHNTNSFSNVLSHLDADPMEVVLESGLVWGEAVSVCRPLWMCAGLVLKAIRPVLMQFLEGDKKEVVEEEEKEEVKQEQDDKIEQQEQESVNDSSSSEKERGDVSKVKKPSLQPPPPPPPPPAVHFVGHSLSGGVASLSAAILDGTLPMPPGMDIVQDKHKKKKRKKKRRRRGSSSTESSSPPPPQVHQESEQEADPNNDNKETKSNNDPPPPSSLSMSGLLRNRASAVALGPPPCLSANVKAAFITSVVHGDDIVPRTSRDSLDRLCQRTVKLMKGGFIGRRMGWISDALSLTVSGLKDHAHGSEGEEAKLSVPGKSYLIRPRRIGHGSSSIHEFGSSIQGRDAIRAALLWQLNDVLLSRSMGSRHGSLGAYVKGLDRVRLRGFVVDDDVVDDDDDV